MNNISLESFPSERTEKQSKRNQRKKVINTLDALVDYIKRQLGEPIIKVEVTNEQIEDCIFNSIDEFAEYGFDGLEDISILVKVENNQKTFILDDRVRAIRNIRTLSNFSNSLKIPGGEIITNLSIGMNFLNNFGEIDITSLSAQLAKLSTLESLFDLSANFTWNENTKELRILDELNTDRILLDLSLQYEPKEQDIIYNNTWIKKNSTSRVKLLWGNNIGKFSSNLVNGATINYDRIISEAQAELQEQHEELLETYREPLGIYVR